MRPLAPMARRAGPRLAVLAALVAVGGRAAAAQGNLSTQGYGYPPGELSAAATATGGSIAEFDAASPLNPAALASWRTPGIAVHYSPEFRRVTAAGVNERTSTKRFPVIAVVLPAGEKYTFGISAATLLDRTWQTRTTSTRQLGTVAETASVAFGSAGAMSDIRFAGAYQLLDRLVIGAGLNVITGQNRLTVSRTGGDSTLSELFSQSSRLEFGGKAVTVGAAWRPVNALSLAASGRLGGTLRASQSDSVLAEGKVPNRYGASVGYTGVAGLMLAARANWDQWSRLTPLLGDGTTQALDAWDYGVGADGTGPRFAGRVLRVRGGVRYRTLPFTAAGEQVKELSFGGGIGVPIARGAAAFDLGLQRAARSTAGDAVKESAYLLTVGVSLRP